MNRVTTFSSPLPYIPINLGPIYARYAPLGPQNSCISLEHSKSRAIFPPDKFVSDSCHQMETASEGQLLEATGPRHFYNRSGAVTNQMAGFSADRDVGKNSSLASVTGKSLGGKMWRETGRIVWNS